MRKQILWYAVVAVAGIVAGLMLSRFGSGNGNGPAAGTNTAAVSPTPTSPAPAQDQEARKRDLERFLAAADKGDFATMQGIGERLFPKGAAVPEADAKFTEYETNSIPPYRVFAFLSHQGEKNAERVMLTLDADGRVESFMAEEMAVVK